ncbi:MAG TPA: type II toxin-antitoxin system RelE/ParE family toxin [Vicinamibacterales bacterium]
MPRTAAARSRGFRIFETDEFQKALGRLRPRPSLRDKLGSYVYPQLRQNPYFGPNIRKLLDYAPATWRYRIGSYRVFYSLDENESIVFLLTIDDRKDAYR